MYNTVLSEDTIDNWIKKVQTWDANVWVGLGWGVNWLSVIERVKHWILKKC
jgi:hypothetical protein